MKEVKSVKDPETAKEFFRAILPHVQEIQKIMKGYWYGDLVTVTLGEKHDGRDTMMCSAYGTDIMMWDDYEGGQCFMDGNIRKVGKV